VSLIFSTSLFAQHPGISIGGNALFPVGDWAEFANTGYGASATYEHGLSKNVLGILYVGYTSIDGSSEYTTITGTTYASDNTWTMVPLLAGGKFYFSPNNDFYATALLGANFITLKISNELGETSESSTEFVGNVNLGFEIKTGPKGAVDISAGYVYISGFSYIGARVGYIFKL
jgi:hypothetical protein